MKSKKILVLAALYFLSVFFAIDDAKAVTECTNNPSICSGGTICADAGYGLKTCIQPKNIGSACSENVECESGNCADAGYNLKTCQLGSVTLPANDSDLCKSYNTNFACRNIDTLSTSSGCQTGKCPGAANIQCCPESTPLKVIAPIENSSECSNFNANNTCTNINTLASTSGCQTGKCPGAANIQCCPKNAPLKPNNGSNETGGSTTFTNPLKFNTVESFLTTIMSAIQRIIVSLALVFIVIGALMYISAGASPGNAEKGKEAITMALVGLAIGIAAPSLLKELGSVLGWGGVDSSAVAGALTLSQIAIKILNFLLSITGILSLIMLVIGAIMYLTSAGDSDRISKGKDIFKYSLLGVIIAMSAMILVQQIATLFS